MTRIRTTIIVGIIALFVAPAAIATDSFPRRGPYRAAVSAKGFESFLEFEFDFKDALDQLAKNPTGDVPISGVLRARPNADQPNVTLHRVGDINADGQIKWIDAIEQPFASAKLGRRAGDFLYTVTFETQTVANVSYSFQGRFVEQRQFDGMYTSLTGVLTRLKNGHKLAEAKVNLIEWTFE
jgi:hypothetical protein